MIRTRSRLLILPLALGTALASTGGSFATKATAAAGSPHHNIDCRHSAVCTEVQDSEQVFGEGNYVGHDEPSVLYYSNQPGSGSRNLYQLTLPTDPAASLANRNGVGYGFQLHPAFWFGMAVCDTQSFPELVSGCDASTDKNIVDPAVSPRHPGTAFMEMQFYPPGFVAWPAGDSCDPTKWCAALNIDSLSENSLTGAFLNSTCLSQIGSPEYVNFAFLTLNGTPHAPPNPVNSTLDTFTPNHTSDLFMNSGDKLSVAMVDTAHGLRITVDDHTSGQTGSMTASAANNFGQVKYAPTGTTCQNIPYDFHPMYSTSSEQTRVPWAAHTYNIAFSDEIGHFDYCTGSTAITPGGGCPAGNFEGRGANREPTDADESFCFPTSWSTLVQVSGCFDPAGELGFDGSSYQPVWPDGNTRLHPTSQLFSSPLTGSGLNVNYDRVAFETDLSRIEANDPTLPCNRFTGQDCTLIPTTDDGQPAAFYPFYSTRMVNGACRWAEGNHIPGSTNDFGQNQQYGTLLSVTYTNVGGGAISKYNDFRQVLSNNPCPATP